MEILVLDVLSWNMSCVTPFAFTKYFVSRFCKENSRKHNTRMKLLKSSGVCLEYGNFSGAKASGRIDMKMSHNRVSVRPPKYQ
ncbi:hypothetical protein RND71_027707 [Anisodus tanguticus]|uniref:Uncharacterized protein n=1 Tax=Anisodus tanguticus TaxID=243964 RepID=A0AAE1RJB5_9SOLA|nr:hypothetical protein RND71_027707 [Anisodus tanguticus]